MWQARKYVAYIVTLWRKSQEAPLELLAAPQVRAVQVGDDKGASVGQGLSATVTLPCSALAGQGRDRDSDGPLN